MDKESSESIPNETKPPEKKASFNVKDQLKVSIEKNVEELALKIQNPEADNPKETGDFSSSAKKMYCRRSKKEITVEVSSSEESVPSLHSLSSETFFANESENLKVRAEERPGKNKRQLLAKSTLSPEAYQEWKHVNRQYPRLRLKRRWPVLEKSGDGDPFNLCKEFGYSAPEDSNFTDTSCSDLDVEGQKVRVQSKFDRLMALKTHWDQMSKEEIEEEIRRNREAWEMKNCKTEYPDQVLLPYLPRIPGKAVEETRVKKYKKKTSSRSVIHEVASLHSLLEQEDEKDQLGHLAVEMDNEIDQVSETARFCSGTDQKRPTSWTNQLKSYFSSAKNRTELLPTTDSGYSEIDTSSRSSSSDVSSASSESLLEAAPPNNPFLFFSNLSTSGYWAIVGVFVVLGCLALYGGHNPSTSDIWRESRASKMTPLEQRYHETAALSRVTNAIHLQNSMFHKDSNVTVRSIVAEIADFHNFLDKSPDPFGAVTFVSQETAKLKSISLDYTMKELNELKVWKPANISTNPEMENFLNLLNDASDDLDKLFGEKFAQWISDVGALGRWLSVQISKDGISALENISITLSNFSLYDLCELKLEPLTSLDGLRVSYQKDLEAHIMLTNDWDQQYQNMDSRVLGLQTVLSKGDPELAMKTLNKLAPSLSKRREPPTTLFAFPRGAEDLGKLAEDLKDPWLEKVFNQGRPLDRLKVSLKYILHLFGHTGFASQLHTRFKEKHPPQSIASSDKLMRKVEEMKKAGLNPEAAYKKLKDLHATLKNQESVRTSLEKSTLADVTRTFDNTREPVCTVLKKLKESVEKAKKHVDYQDALEAIAKNKSLDDDDDYNFKALRNELAAFSVDLDSDIKGMKVAGTNFNDATLSTLKEVAAVQSLLVNSSTLLSSKLETYRSDMENSLAMMDLFNVEADPSRKKRQADAYVDLRTSLEHLVRMEEALDEVTADDMPPGFDQLLRFNNSEKASKELGYSQRVMEALVNLDKTIITIQQEGPNAGWDNSTEVVKTLKGINPKGNFGSAEESKDLKQHSETYKALDKITIPTIDMASWRKEVESLPTPNAKLIGALDQLDGLDYAKMRTKKETGKIVDDVDQFFTKFFGREYPKEEIIGFDPSIPLFIIASLTLLHIVAAINFYKYELYIKAYRADLPAPPPLPPPPPVPKDPPPPFPHPLRNLNKKDTGVAGGSKPAQKFTPLQGKGQSGTVKEETNAKGDHLIWDIPPGKPDGLEDPNMKPEEEANLLWVPFGDQPKDHDLSYGSDDLRSIGINSLSSQSDHSDMMASTRSDYTFPGISASEDEDLLDIKEYAEFPKEAKMGEKELWKKLEYPWALKNRLALLGYRTMTEMQIKALKEVDAANVVADKEDVPVAKKQKEDDDEARNQWNKMLEENIDEVLRRRVNQEEVCRIQMAKQELEQRVVELEKAIRDPVNNARKYIEESYIPNPEEEVSITRIAYGSVNKIDNFIQSVHHDRWDHLYRCKSDMYTHDWARVKMSKDDPDDVDFYDACYVYPWQEVFNKVVDQYRNRLICVASPMFAETVPILWHWLYEHEVEYMVMLNQFIEKNLQTSEVWFPLREGDMMRVKRSHCREYIIKCTDAKEKFKLCGVQRCFEITLVEYGRRMGTKKLKLLHMIDWDQDGLPMNWQHYVRVCERINKESMKKPVAVMSKHGSGRAMALILSLMGAILARLDDDVSIHSLTHGARASKRHAITCCNQIYFWRMVHYELLFRWFKPLREYRVRMDERFEAYQDIVLAHKHDFILLECRLWWYLFECELARYQRMDFMSDYLRQFNEGLRFEAREERRLLDLYTAREKHEQDEEKLPYYDLEPIRRKPLREGDKPRDKNRPKQKPAERDDLLPLEAEYGEWSIDPLIGKLDGSYHWVKPSEEAVKFVKGVDVPENWKHWVTKDQQTGKADDNKFF